MRPAGLIGVLLIVFGAIVLVIGGVSYVKDRHKVDLGVAKVTTEERGFIPPWLGAVALAGGLVLVMSGRRRGDAV
jgi:Na+/proline symporter